MTERARAWVLHEGAGRQAENAELLDEEIELPAIDPAGDQVLAEPVYGCWAGNMTHALERVPIDVCRHRREKKVVLGNSAAVRVLRAGQLARRSLREGQLAMLFCASVVDEHGYPIKALAYDAPGTMGCLAKRMVVRAHELLPIPEGTRHGLEQWAAFSSASITAWSNLELALGTLRLLIPEDELPHPHVWGWGGGTTLAELDLARRRGCLSVQLSASPLRREAIARAGVTALDRAALLGEDFDEARFAADAAYRRAYLDGETRFLREVQQRTGGRGVHIFVDYIGAPVYRATLKALAREGIITTAGWKRGMEMKYLRAAECISRHQHLHTHFARYPQGVSAAAYGEREGWMPEADAKVWSFDEIPALAATYARGETGFYPTFSVNAP